MGKVVAADTHLRAWGSKTRLDTKGMFRTTLITKKGAKKETWVYIVAGTKPEPLLGDADAEDLGIIEFNPEGRPATPLGNRQHSRSHTDHPSQYPCKAASNREDSRDKEARDQTNR